MKITKEMIVREVVKQFPQTVNVFGKFKVDFCCGGAHSIEQTATARGCADVEALVAELNRAAQEEPKSEKSYSSGLGVESNPRQNVWQEPGRMPVCQCIRRGNSRQGAQGSATG
jgi:hypothetical protein